MSPGTSAANSLTLHVALLTVGVRFRVDTWRSLLLQRGSAQRLPRGDDGFLLRLALFCGAGGLASRSQFPNFVTVLLQ